MIIRKFVLICLQILFPILNNANGVLDWSSLGPGHAKIGNYSFMDTTLKWCGYINPKERTGAQIRSRPQERIIKGDEALIGEFPWQTAIYHKYKPHKDNFLCGGVLIHKIWVLTARHCVEPPHQSPIKPHVLTVTMGTLIKYEYPTGLTFNVSHYEVHKWTDLALLRLSTPVQPERSPNDAHYKVNFACLPNDTISNSANEYAMVSGFGDTTEDPSVKIETKLQKTKIFTSSVDHCKHMAIEIDWICAFSHDDQMTCFGDSGSGLIQFDGHRAVVIGIVIDSINNIGGHKCSAGVMRFLRISQFIPFFEFVIKNDLKATPEPPHTLVTTDGSIPDPDRHISENDNNGYNMCTKSNLLVNIIVSMIAIVYKMYFSE